MINDKHMELIKDEYKESYLLFTRGSSLMPFSSHQPVLIHTLNTITEGDVLEYGMGWNSTPIMHLICGLQDRKLISVETDKTWFNKFVNHQSTEHEVLCLGSKELREGSHDLFKRKYSIVFIDGSNEAELSRQKFIEIIKDNVDYFVVHDTEEKAGNFTYPKFTYAWDFSGFKHVYHLHKGGPATSLLSNLENINEDLLTVFQ